MSDNNKPAVGSRLRLLWACIAMVTSTAMVSGCSDGTDSAPVGGVDSLAINQLQYLGTHNSYHLSMGEERLKQYAVLVPEAKAWDYEHAPLDVQLEHGVRSFELDLYWDGARLHVMHVPISMTTVRVNFSRTVSRSSAGGPRRTARMCRLSCSSS